MGMLIDGTWHFDGGVIPVGPGGSFVRPETSFRHWITRDGVAGPSGEAGFPAEAGRYHLYVSLACPWASRTLIYRSLKGLTRMIGLSITHWLWAEQGWTFSPGEGVVPDSRNGASFLHQLYTRAHATYSGRASVPVLWDTHRNTIVSNESADIIRMFNSAFDGVGAAAGDYYPEPLRAEIDAINDRVYATLNNGVYKAGFAVTQHAYEAAVAPLFETLDWLDARLRNRRFLVADTPMECDWRLFTTLIRFDAVYYGHFKCNLRRLSDYLHLSAYTRDLFQWPGVAETVDMNHIKRHYYMSHKKVNPTGIVPVGPLYDFGAPHGRSDLAL
ncbi:glutathione S-transferase family protein [Pendulispora rubella]|uniref:Glutathione S-transferase family protein n=1 Tax=Pendulispora rubella TaxID=2741070 RepID=A0ABZ2KR08_9BACT